MHVLWIRRSSKLAGLANKLKGRGLFIKQVRTFGKSFLECFQHSPNVVVVESFPQDPLLLPYLRSYRKSGITIPLLGVFHPFHERFFCKLGGEIPYVSWMCVSQEREIENELRSLISQHRRFQGTLSYSDLCLNFLTHEAFRGGKKLELTQIQYRILLHLLRKPGYLVTKEAMARAIWGQTWKEENLSNHLSVHMNLLRKKVDLPFDRCLIQTVRGRGFLLKAGSDE